MGGSVVVSLFEFLENFHFRVYFDSYFTSAKLIGRLCEAGFGATGTVRANRVDKCPIKSTDNMKKEARGTFDHKYDCKDGILIARWNDNSVVTVTSNCCGIQPIAQASGWSTAEGRRVTINQPDLIQKYNKSMGGVDRLDQNVAIYRINIRTKKWWWPFFAYFLDVCIQNAWLLYRNSAAALVEHLDLLEFRRCIANTYFMQYANDARPKKTGPTGRPAALNVRVPADVRFDRMDHFVTDIPKQLRCAACPGKAKTKCIKCNVGLHVACFVRFHQRR